MDSNRRRKYMLNKNVKEKISINFDLITLELMSSYIINDNVKRSNLMNLKNLLDIMDINIYIGDSEKMKYINFMNKILEARLVHNFSNQSIIDRYIKGGIIDNEDPNIVKLNSLAVLESQEIEYVSQTISEALKYSYIYNDIDKLYDMIIRFKTTDYTDRGSIVKELEEEIVHLNNLFRKCRVEKESEIVFSLNDNSYENAFREIHRDLVDPKCRLFTGMQGFNKLIGGAFETGRTYMILGLAGAGKSMALLNLAKQIKDYNTRYKTSDPNKKPCIVILTMENSVKETVDRLFEICTGMDMKKMPVEDAIYKLKESGMIVNDQSPIDILIKYIPNRSIDTNYLYTLYEDLEDEGYEMICLIQDHVKRIKSIEKTSEPRFELGNVINEFKTFSILKKCVMITNAHLNREAARSIDDGRNNNKRDLLKFIGRANTGESMLMIDNVDVAMVINQEIDENGTRYMGFKRVKERVKVDPSFNMVFQPFKENSMCLIEDFNLRVPLHKESLVVAPSLITQQSNNEAKYINTNIIFDSEEDELLSFTNNDKYGNIQNKKLKK